MARIFGQEDAQPLLSHRAVARAPITACLGEDDEVRSLTDPDDDDDDTACDADELPMREGNYLWSMAQSVRKNNNNNNLKIIIIIIIGP